MVAGRGQTGLNVVQDAQLMGNRPRSTRVWVAAGVPGSPEERQGGTGFEKKIAELICAGESLGEGFRGRNVDKQEASCAF